MLETKRLYLDVPSEKHFEAIFKVHADPTTQCFNPNGPVTHINRFRETYQTWLVHHHTYQFGYYILVDKEDHQPFGVCGLRYGKIKNEVILNVYYRIATEKTRKGFVKEAASKIIDEVLALTNHQYRVVIVTKENKVPSIKTAESLGFQYDKTLDDYEGQGNVYYFNNNNN